MSRLYKELLQEENYLKELISVTAEAVNQAPEGRLRISHCRKTVQYYKVDAGTNKNNGEYIRKKDLQLAYDLAQRDYDLSLLKEAKARLEDVQKLLEDCKNTEMEMMFENLNPYRKELVEPRVLSEEEFVKKWNEVKFTGKPFQEGTIEIYTNKGERVRSKSEKIIADALYQKGIPYRYEAPINLVGMGIVHPDFTVLNVKERKEIYWEHLGMMDKSDYCENALRKLEVYQKNKIILGDKLIVSYETSLHPLETQMIDRNIGVFCV